MTKYKLVPCSEIYVNPSAIRTPDKDGESYQGSLASVAKDGVEQSVTVRPTDIEGYKYELCDGSHRFHACLDLGIETIPVGIKAMTDSEFYATQFGLNHHRKANTPAQTGDQVIRLMASLEAEGKPCGIADVAEQMSVTVSFVDNCIKISKNIASDDIKAKVDAGAIKATNALTLSKAPKAIQEALVVEAEAMPSSAFAEFAKDKATEYRKETRSGNKEVAPEKCFSSKAKARKLITIHSLIEDPTPIIPAEKRDDVVFVAGIVEGLKASISLDSNTVGAARQSFDDAIQAKAEKDEKRKLLKAEKAEAVKVAKANAVKEAEAKFNTELDELEG